MPTSAGIELSHAAVRVAVLDGTTARAACTAVREVSCDTADPAALTQALTQLRQQLRLDQPVIIGMPSTSAILTTVTPLIVSPQRAALAVAFELQQQIPFQLADTAWHSVWMANGHSAKLSGPGTRAAVAAAMRRSLLEERLACCRRAGLRVAAVGVNPIAALNAWWAARGAAAGPAVVLLNLVDDLTAEWIMWGPAGLQIMPIANASVDALWNDLMVAWETWQAQQPGIERPAQILVVGGPEESFPLVQQRLSQRAGVPVERFDPKQALPGGGPPAGERGAAASAVGLALQGLGPVRVPLNLLEYAQEERRAHGMRSASTMVSAACAVAIVGLGAGVMWDAYQRRTAIMQWLQQREHLYETLRPDLRSALKAQEHLQERTQQLDQVAAEAPLLGQVLAQITDAMPDTVWLTKFDAAKTGEAVEGVLEGRAKSFQDVTLFFDRLKTVAGMTMVKPLSTTVVTEGAAAAPAAGAKASPTASSSAQPEAAAASPGQEQISFSVQVQRLLLSTAPAATQEPDAAASGKPAKDGPGTRAVRKDAAKKEPAKKGAK